MMSMNKSRQNHKKAPLKERKEANQRKFTATNNQYSSQQNNDTLFSWADMQSIKTLMSLTNTHT